MRQNPSTCLLLHSNYLGRLKQADCSLLAPGCINESLDGQMKRLMTAALCTALALLGVTWTASQKRIVLTTSRLDQMFSFSVLLVHDTYVNSNFLGLLRSSIRI